MQISHFLFVKNCKSSGSVVVKEGKQKSQIDKHRDDDRFDQCKESALPKGHRKQEDTSHKKKDRNHFHAYHMALQYAGDTEHQWHKAIPVLTRFRVRRIDPVHPVEHKRKERNRTILTYRTSQVNIHQSVRGHAVQKHHRQSHPLIF